MVFYKKKCFLKLFFVLNHDEYLEMVTHLNRPALCTSTVKVAGRPVAKKWPAGRPVAGKAVKIVVNTIEVRLSAIF